MKYLSLEEIQQEELKLLIELTDFLDEKQLRYSLHAGTLLGAVRHGGFIPWDDDIDIAMPRPDYERLREIASELPTGLSFIHDYNSPLPLRFGKVCTDKIRAQQDVFDSIFEQYLWVDIFPIDGLPDNEAEQKTLFNRALNNKRMFEYLTLDASVTSSALKGLIVSLYRLLPGKKSRRAKLNKQHEELLALNPFETSTFVSTSYCSDSATLWVWEKNDYFPLEQIEFAGHLFSCYKNKEKLLEMWYGDYMQLPPESERLTHSMKCWRVEQ